MFKNKSWILKITNQEVLGRVRVKNACQLVDIINKKMAYFGHIVRHSTIHNALFEGEIKGRRSRSRSRTMIYVDGEHKTYVRIWLRGGNKESKRQELLAATHCIRPSNGWNLMLMIDSVF